jgi:hypothetical protein
MKYRVLKDMEGWNKGDIVEGIDETVAHNLVKLGYFEPLPIEEVMQDTQIKKARHKSV